MNREVSKEIRSGRGIAAGSPFAPYELAVYLDGLIGIVRAWNAQQSGIKSGLRATLSIHVDDISVCISGTNSRAIAHAAGSLARSLAAHVTELGMKLDLGDKAFLMASSDDLLVAAKAAIPTSINRRIRPVADARMRAGKSTWDGRVGNTVVFMAVAEIVAGNRSSVVGGLLGSGRVLGTGNRLARRRMAFCVV